MIDLIDVTIRLKHDGKVNNGYKVSRKKDESKNKRYFCIKVKGKHDKSISVVSVGKNHLRIIGSPLSYLQVQNVFGSDNLIELVCEVATIVTQEIGITPSRKDVESWKNGLFKVNRLDVTYNFQMLSRESVVDWLTEAGLSIVSGRQRVDTIRSSSSQAFETIVLGKTSDFVSVKFYDKYRQLLSSKNMRRALNRIPVMSELLEHTKPLLRCEIRFHAKYLKDKHLTQGHSLTPEVIRHIYFKKLNSVNLGSSTIIPKPQSNLTKTDRFIYKLWLRGENTKELVANKDISEITLTRLDKKLKPFGVNIRRKLAEQVAGQELSSFLDPSNIADTPEFLKDTPWLF